jgi:hypothetical protein
MVVAVVYVVERTEQESGVEQGDWPVIVPESMGRTS